MLNRPDAVVMFSPLSVEDVERMVGLQLRRGGEADGMNKSALS